MGSNDTEQGYTDEAAPFIKENGGKIGGLGFVRAKDPELAQLVPPTLIIPPDQEEINELPFETDVIVRASIKGDFRALVDVLRTEVVKRCDDGTNKMIDRVNEAIRRIRRYCTSEEVMRYGQHEDPDFDGKITIGIQPFFNFPIASVMEHPNRPGQYIISHVDKGPVVPGLGKTPDIHGSKLFGEDGEELESYADHYETNKAGRIIEVYRRIQGLGLLQDGLVPQVELADDTNGDTLKILQIRFGARKKLADFTLDRWSHYIALTFGVTEGVELPLFHSHDDYWGKQDLTIPHALMKTLHCRRICLGYRPPELPVYLGNFSFGSGYPGLEHNQFSLVQKARVSVLERKYGCAFQSFDRGGPIEVRGPKTPELPEGFTGDKIRIICDGVHALVELVK